MHSTELTWDTGPMRFLGQLIVTALALWVTALILPGMHLGDGSAPLLTQVLTIGAIALILALVTTIVRPILSLLALPITCLTLGLFQLVINTLMLLLTSWISAQFGLTLQFDSFWWALLAGIVIGVLSAIVEAVTGLGDGERREA
ncbi:phage holin family protein [Brachybacterium sp. p3-SID957]|uniref:phage holin family protein n=1 Tax=Brachybacterium sp. p3-SID957 TaxID=2916049 RepID=UPI00223B45DF|nr:phage holin family protein [Brachybacterium sp. p3-SID957]MCT1776249.1 phage holin family protein [Brachybacterium sp. p3-SID957]